MSLPMTRRAGYTLVEVLVAVGIIGLLVTFAQTMFFRIQHQQRARDGMRNVMSILGEARNTALILGSAASTTRVTFLTSGPGQCPAEFSGNGIDGEAGRSAVMVDTGAAPTNPAANDVGNSITYVSQIQKVTGTSPARYVIGCSTVNLTNVFRGNIRFETTGTTWQNTAPNKYLLVYDARGFITNSNVQVPGITMVETEGRRLAQRVLTLGSGYSCFEDQATINLSSLSSPPARPRCASN